jgi:hypothetical protein
MPLVSWLDQPNNIKEPSSRFLEGRILLPHKERADGLYNSKKQTNKLHIKGLTILRDRDQPDHHYKIYRA